MIWTALYIVIEDASFTLAIKNNKISEDIFFGNHIFINTTIDTSNIINVNDAKQKAFDLAKENKEAFRSMPVLGECYLVYDENDKLCYKVNMNYSCVKINAITGEVVDSYFFDGIYY